MTNLDIVRSTYEGKTANENAKALKNHLATDVRWTEAAGFPYAGTYVGYAAIFDSVFSRLATEWNDYKIEVSDYTENTDTVIAYGTYSGTYKSTGKSFTARVAHLFTLSDGRITHFEQIVDSASVMAAMAPNA